MTKTILAVDDSGSLRQMVVFSPAGGRLLSDGSCRWPGRTRQGTGTVVLTDQNMPRMDGFTLIRSLRTLLTYQRVPILVLTTESGDEMRANGRAAGANG